MIPVSIRSSVQRSSQGTRRARRRTWRYYGRGSLYLGRRCGSQHRGWLELVAYSNLGSSNWRLSRRSSYFCASGSGGGGGSPSCGALWSGGRGFCGGRLGGAIGCWWRRGGGRCRVLHVSKLLRLMQQTGGDANEIWEKNVQWVGSLEGNGSAPGGALRT